MADNIRRNPFKIFLCHAGEDKVQVNNVYQRLHNSINRAHMEHLVSVFFDIETLTGGAEGNSKGIFSFIDECDVFVIFVSEDSINKKWPLKELEHALMIKSQKPDMVILPVFCNVNIDKLITHVKNETRDKFPLIEDMLTQISKYQGIRFPIQGIEENWDGCNRRIVERLATLVDEAEPFHKLLFSPEEKPISITRPEQRDELKRRIEACNSAAELLTLWKTSMIGLMSQLQELPDHTSRFNWSLSFARSLLHKHPNAIAANEIRQILKIWASQLIVIMEQKDAPALNQEEYKQFQTIMLNVLNYVLPMDKANALIALPNPLNPEQSGKDWISEEQFIKIRKHPLYEAKLVVGDKGCPMGRKLVKLARFFNLAELEPYLSPVLLNASEEENQQLALLLKDKPIATQEEKKDRLSSAHFRAGERILFFMRQQEDKVSARYHQAFRKYGFEHRSALYMIRDHILHFRLREAKAALAQLEKIESRQQLKA